MLKAKIPTVSLVNSRQDTPCPVDPKIRHCHCSAKTHTCGWCKQKW